MDSFSDQVKEKGALCRALCSTAVFVGYGVGTVRAHTDPALKAVRRKLKELTPETLLMACHAYSEGKALGKEEESFRRAKRQARRGDLAGAAKSAWQGAVG